MPVHRKPINLRGVSTAAASSPGQAVPPSPACRLKRGLHEIIRKRAVSADQDARVPEQVAGVNVEACGEFLGVARGDLLVTHPWAVSAA